MTAGRAGGGVLHVTQQWLPASEGFVYDLVRRVRRPGAVVSFARPVNRARFPFDPVVSVRLFELLPGPLRGPAVTAALLGIARRQGASLVHVHHGYRLDAVLGLSRRAGLPLVVSLHGDDLTGFRAEHPEVYERAAPDVAAAVVPSRFLAGIAVDAGFDPERVVVVPSGIDTGLFTPSPVPEDPVALFVGRFVAKKGLDVLARAWPAVQAAVPAARLRILGYGELEPLARAIPGRVEVVTAPGRPEVARAMAAARVVVSPSHEAPGDAFDTLLMVNVEAQASGRPVVTTRHGGIPEYVRQGETALLVDEHDDAGLAEALVRVLSDDDLARRLGAAGPAAAAPLDLSRTAALIDGLYDAVLAGRPLTPGQPTAL